MYWRITFCRNPAIPIPSPPSGEERRARSKKKGVSKILFIFCHEQARDEDSQPINLSSGPNRVKGCGGYMAEE